MELIGKFLPACLGHQCACTNICLPTDYVWCIPLENKNQIKKSVPMYVMFMPSLVVS